MKTLERPSTATELARRFRFVGRRSADEPSRDAAAQPSLTAKAANALTVFGVVCLAFALLQVVVGDATERRAQRSLRATFAATVSTGAGLGKDAKGKPKPIPQGSPVAMLDVPKLGLHKVVVEGVGPSELKRGPGVLSSTQLPGQPGHSIIAGRRTTYGSPFRNLHKLAADDEIFVTSPYGRFEYKVTDVRTLKPGEATRTRAMPGAVMTLLTSDPPRVGGRALAVISALQGDPSMFPDPPRIKPAAGSGVSFAGNAAAGPVVLATALLLVAAVVAAGALYRRWHRWPTYLLTTPVILALGYVLLESVQSLLPSTL